MGMDGEAYGRNRMDIGDLQAKELEWTWSSPTPVMTVCYCFGHFGVHFN